MELRKLLDEEEARSALAAVASSGLSRQAWARRHGVSPRSLNAWQINLGRKDRRGEPPPLRLVELTTDRAPGAAIYAVVVDGGVRVEVGDDFVDATLRRLLGVVRAC